jgi:hypothetical protein
MRRLRLRPALAFVVAATFVGSIAPALAAPEAAPVGSAAAERTSIVALRSSQYGRYDNVTTGGAADGLLAVTGDASQVVAVYQGVGFGTDASITISNKAGRPLLPGPYEDVVDSAIADPNHPRLHLTGFASTGCTPMAERFDVLELAFGADGQVDRLTVDTEQVCSQNANLTIKTRVRFHSADLFAPSPGPDQDDDGVDSTVDNCRLWANPSQADTDGDGIGDYCDPEQAVVPSPPTTVHRLAGADRIETAIAASRDLGDPSTVVLARADSFADALAGTPLAAALDAPLLLTDRASLDPRVLAEVQRVLQPGDTVHLLGGEASLGPAVAKALTDAHLTVVRHAGADRYATAVDVAQAVEAADGEVHQVLLATGTNFPDGLSAGAAAAASHAVLLLTNGATLPVATASYLLQHPDWPVTAVGGQAAVAAPTAAKVVGVDRYATALAVRVAFFPADVGTAGLASGATFPDALAGGVHAARLGGPLLLTPGSSLAPGVEEQLGHHVIERVDVYGGPPVISSAVVDQLRRDVATAPRPALATDPPPVVPPVDPPPPVTLPGLPPLPDPVGDILEQIACVDNGSGHVVVEHLDGVYLVDADHGCARVVLRGTAVGVPTFSPDGRYVIVPYVHGTGPFAPWALWKIDILTGLRQQITPPADGLGRAEWSPDGEWISYESFGTQPYLPYPPTPEARASNEIWLVRPDGTDRHRLMPADGWGFSTWSADGKRLAVVLRNDDHLAIADVDTGLVRYHPIPEDAYLASWSPDGTQLVFNANDDDEKLLYMMDPDTGDYRPIAQQAAFPRWSPDGRWIAVSRDDHLVLLRPDGTTGPTVGAYDLPLNWSDDGRYLLSSGGTVFDMVEGESRTITWPGPMGPWPQASRWVPGTHTFAVVSTGTGSYTP